MLRQVHLPGGSSSTGGLPTATAGVAVTNRTAGSLAVPEQITGAQVVHIRYDLTRNPPSTVGDSVGWANPGNAAGTRNGTLATLTGGVSATSGSISLDYPTATGKDSLTVTAVHMRFYGRLRGAVLDNASLAYYSRLGAVETLRGEWTVDVDHLTTPLAVDLGALTWAQIGTVSAHVVGSTNAGAATAVVELDAVELVITATRTDTL